MKRKFFSFIRPSLSMLDNGTFFRKPFGWLYGALAATFLLSPFLLAYLAFWLNKTTENRDECLRAYQTLAKPAFEKTSQQYDTLKTVADQYGKEMNNAVDCLSKATKQADYYGEYASFGPEYQQYYTNALDVKRQWDAVYKDATRRWESANADLEAVKPEYEKARRAYEVAARKLSDAEVEYQKAGQFGAIFHRNNVSGGSSVLTIILMSLMLLLVGVINFFVWWSRMLSLRRLNKVQDRFVATPLAAHFIQTLGESIGVTVAFGGFFIALTECISGSSFGLFGWQFLDWGWATPLLPVMAGFLLAFVFRIVSELLKAIVVIADNTSV